MALVHNCIIRGLNAIYRQAPYVSTRSDIHDFIGYIKAWCLTLSVHHDTEEAISFPLLEAMTGVKGIMNANVLQHEAFYHGLKALEVYATACHDYKAAYDGNFVREIIDKFGPTLTVHLADEIKTLEAMDDYEERIDWELWTEKTKEHAINLPGMEYAAPMILTNMDVTFEKELHRKHWPPFNWLLVLFIRWYLMPMQKDLWKFSSCDSYGMPRKFPFLESDSSCAS
ncbi:hemerythrin HHE cation binding domain-containing protein [Bisporella sp. PMI_857]|nr:hemerythrin HHE cation binding domain-containing protein [Bisporella sp. PMI_857]